MTDGFSRLTSADRTALLETLVDLTEVMMLLEALPKTAELRAVALQLQDAHNRLLPIVGTGPLRRLRPAGGAERPLGAERRRLGRLPPD